MPQPDETASVPSDDPASLRELALYFGNLQHQRLNHVLLAESLLFAGVATTLDPRFHLFRMALSLFSLLLTLLLWRTLWGMQVIVDRADSYLRARDALYRQLSPATRSSVAASSIYAWWLPSMFTVAWVVVFFWSLCQETAGRAMLDGA